MADASLFWHEALNDPDVVANIYGGDVNVEGFLLSPLQLDSAVQWSSPLEEILRQKAGQAAGMIPGKFGDLIGAGMGMGMASQLSPTSLPLWTSTKNWMASNGPTLPLTLLFIAVDEDTDVTLPVKNLSIGTHSKSEGGVAQTPPNGYVYGMGTEPKTEGTLSVKLGSWFHAKNLYLIDSMTVSFSQQVLVGSGKPLYSEVQLQMSPYRMIDRDEYQALFV